MRLPFIRIVGGRPLEGDITVSGAKNSALILMAATILTEEEVHFTRVPQLSDITDMVAILHHLGADVLSAGKNELKLRARHLHTLVAPYDLVSKLRASFLILGPMLARYGRAQVALPGGDAIGARPVDIHLKGLAQMGANVELIAGNIHATCSRLQGAHIVLSFPSVNATQQLMMAATLADGETHLCGVAREPEVVDLAICLRAMGADLEGEGTDRIIIRGQDQLHGAVHEVIPDRIETGTYMMAALMAGGNLRIHGAGPESMPAVWEMLARFDGAIAYREGVLHIQAEPGKRWPAMDMTTQPFPGFATDLQPQFMSLMTLCDGLACITETLFENRFMHVPELIRMGANIHIQGRSAYVQGVPFLSGAPVQATDIRASVSLIAAGLAAQGQTQLVGIEHIDRGYERLEEKLQACGAIIERIA